MFRLFINTPRRCSDKTIFPMELLLRFTIPRILVLLIVFNLIVVGCTANPSKSSNTSSNVVNGEQNLVSNGDIELLNNGEPVDWNCNVRLPALNRKKCSVDSPGFQSDHALTMPANGSNFHLRKRGQVYFIG
jgi:hypothetical protein